jgi:hypothetical protein
MIQISGHGDAVAKALARLVNGVGKDLEKGMLTSLKTVGAKDDGRAATNAVSALELGNALVVISVFIRISCHDASIK